jgi:hypothetical protein
MTEARWTRPGVGSGREWAAYNSRVKPDERLLFQMRRLGAVAGVTSGCWAPGLRPAVIGRPQSTPLLGHRFFWRWGVSPCSLVMPVAHAPSRRPTYFFFPLPPTFFFLFPNQETFNRMA